MSQKVTTKKITSKTNIKPNATSKPTTSQTTTKKTDEKANQKPSPATNKNVKTTVKTVNKSNNKLVKGPTTDQVKKTDANKTTVKTVGIKNTNSSTKTTLKSNTVVKPGVKNTDLSKNNQNIRKEKEKLVEKQKKQTVVTQSNSKNINNDTQYSAKLESNRSPTETLKNQVSSNHQNILLATLETNTSYKQFHGRSSESILAEPPSIREQELDETVNNISDNRTDYYESDYYDDFEDYESDFEDDEEGDGDEEEEEEEQEQSDHDQYMKAETSDRDLNISQSSHYQTNGYNSYNENNINSKLLEENFKTEVTNRQTESRIESTFLSIADIKSAHLRSESEVHMNKAIKRGNELLEIIKLNKIGFTNCDLPPINYDIFIRTFGRRDAKQVSCQTCEREDIQIQTESVIVDNKWTQNPSFTRIHAGNDDEENKIVCHMPNIDPFELSKFLTKAQTIMSAIIDCEFGRRDHKTSLPPGAERFSSDYFIIKCLELAKKCPISYTFTNSLYLFCVQNVTKMMGSAEKSVIVVWNLLSPKQPEKILICRSHIISAYSDNNIVVAAMIDGSVALWDLNEQLQYHKEMVIEQNKFILRSPSYNSAATGKGHNFAVVAINKITYHDLDDDSLHFATIDEMGFLIIWAINEVKGDINDFGVSPNSNWKLSRISVIETLKSFRFDTSVKITTFECQPNDWSHFYCGTDNGLVIRCTRHEESLSNLPKIFTNNQMNSFWTSVTKISFNKSEKSHFLVGQSDGLISYYSITNENPLIVFDANHSSIIDFKWISDANSTFIALNKSNQIFIWDLINEDMKPIVYYRHQNNRLSSISLWKGIDSVLVFGSDCGNAFVFVLNNSKISGTSDQTNHSLI